MEGSSVQLVGGIETDEKCAPWGQFSFDVNAPEWSK